MRKNKLKYYRNVYNVKQQDLAYFLNIHVSTYNVKEQGIRDFKDNEKIKIQEYFKNLGSDLSIDELFF